MDPTELEAESELFRLVLGEVSLVDEGDNPPADIVIVKRRQKGEPGMGKVAKASFDEIRMEQRARDIMMALRARVDALSESIASIIFNFDGTPRTPEESQEQIQQSISQFSGAVDAELEGIFAGRISKALHAAKVTRESLAETLQELLGTEPEFPGGGEQMDLSKLSAKDREAVEKALAAAKGATDATERVAQLEAELAELRKAAKGAGAADPPADPAEGLPAEVRKAVAPLLEQYQAAIAAERERNASLAKRFEILEEDAARTTFEKSLGDLDGLSLQRDELADLLWSISSEDVRGKVAKVLEAASAAVQRGGDAGLFGQLGTDTEPIDPNQDAYDLITAKAEKLLERRPELGLAKARRQVMRENPDLYLLYREQNMGVGA